MVTKYDRKQCDIGQTRCVLLHPENHLRSGNEMLRRIEIPLVFPTSLQIPSHKADVEQIGTRNDKEHCDEETIDDN